MKKFHSTIVKSAVIILLLAVIPAFAGADTIRYTYDSANQLTKAIYADVTSVEYTYDGSGNRQTKAISLLGNISASPASLDFGNINVGSASPAQAITISNTGVGSLVIGSITLTGANASEFIITTDACSGQTIPPSGTCQIQITFNPLSIGSKTATLSIPSDDPDTPESNVPLSGTGTVTLTVTKTGAGTGAVTSSPSGINCGADCTETYTESTNVTLTAQPDTCSTFAGWSGACTGTGACEVTMDADTTVTASFNATNPVADFSGSPTSGPLPLTVNFTDLSTCATSWGWDFGDTGTSILQNPSHTYDQLGSFTVSLTASNASNSNTLTRVNYITVQCPNPVRIARTGATYASLQAAYDAAADGDIIQSQAVRFTENLNINRNIAVTLEGGYDCLYTSNAGNTTELKGQIHTYSGSGNRIKVKNFILKK